jgi:RNA polymerase I-specific transcription initiation factor RRN6
VDSLLHEEENDPFIAVNLIPLSPPIMRSEDDINSARYPPYLSDVYDKMIECWISCLPLQTPGQTRLAKERIVRDIAAELCLSSLSVTIHNKSGFPPESIKPLERFDLTLPVRPRSNFSSQESGASQVLDTKDTLGAFYTTTVRVPTLTSTPPHTREETAPSRAPVEDSSILRLRSYALSINPQPPLSATASSILEHWPTTPGLDPANYSWEMTCKATAEIWDEDGDEEDAISRRKEERHRHRTEKFLKRQRVNPGSTASQPVPTISFGSQPNLAVNITSSQPTENALPMTQPDRGVFGSRLGQKSWKKRRIKGF